MKKRKKRGEKNTFRGDGSSRQKSEREEMRFFGEKSQRERYFLQRGNFFGKWIFSLWRKKISEIIPREIFFPEIFFFKNKIIFEKFEPRGHFSSGERNFIFDF